MRSQIRTAWRKADGSAAWNFFRYGQCCRRRNIAARQMESWMLWRVFSPDLRDVSLPGMRSIWDRRCIVTGDGSDAKGTVDKAARPANSAESNRSAFCADDATRNTEITQAVIADSTGRIYGSYIHGLFDMGEIAGRMIQTLAREKGISLENGVWEDYRTIKERQYDKLADTLREYLRMEEIYGMLREARIL